jgi:hypothetical protein
MRTLIRVVALVLALALPPAVSLPAQPKPIKVGVLALLTGGAAQVGRDMVNGFEMYPAEAGNQMAGREAERKNGELRNPVIHTSPGASQFWTYEPEEFLNPPVCSREHPPWRHC